MQISETSLEFNKFILKLQKKINKISLSNYNKKLFIKFKNNKKNDVVTNLDIKVEKFLKKEIKKKFPYHNIKGEELQSKKNNSNFSWFIDPIDGTKGMVIGLTTWSNMFGLFYSNKAICSLINYPMMNKFYFTFKKKSFVSENNKIKMIKSSKVHNLNKAKIITNSIHTLKNKYLFNFFKNFEGFFKITGADSYNFCLIAEGKVDILIEDKLKIVDIMPTISLIENAGAIITDWNGNRNFKLGKVLVTSNKKLHSLFLKKLKKI